MRISALVLGTVGGAIGLIAVGVLYLLGADGGVPNVRLIAMLSAGGFASMAGIAGGVLAVRLPLVGGSVMLAAAIIGAIAIAGAFAVSTILLLIGSAMALYASVRAMDESYLG